MAIAEDSKRLNGELEFEMAAMLAIHFSKQDKAIGVRHSRKAQELALYYLRRKSKIVNTISEAVLLKGYIAGCQRQINDLIKKATNGQGTVDDVKKATLIESMAQQAVDRLEILEKGLHNAES